MDTITRPLPRLFARHEKLKPFRGPSRDRSLPGKARIRARKEQQRHARAVARTWFFKGHGWAGTNDYNLRYDCRADGCGFTIIAPHDDLEFMTDVMEHEQTHEVAW